MKDRIPAAGMAGRVLITPEDGSAPYYARMTRADNPAQEGDPLSKKTFLQDSTALTYGLTEDAVPNDVLKMLLHLVGRYRIELQLFFAGQPEAGVQVIGLETLDGKAVYTDASGRAVGYTYERTGTLTIPQVFLDIPEYTILYDTGGYLLTSISDNAWSDPSIKRLEITESCDFRLSAAVPSFDAFLAGGGGSGAVSIGVRRACSGGGGGYTTTLFGVANNTKAFTAAIGAGGEVSVTSGQANGEAGGTTTLSQDGETLGEAAGGEGGKATTRVPDVVPDAGRYLHVTGGAGGSGGGGAYHKTIGIYSYENGGVGSGGSDGEDGGSPSESTGAHAEGGAGQKTTTRAFGDSEEKLYCGGGAGVCCYYDGDNDQYKLAAGGNGGGGASNENADDYGGGGGGVATDSDETVAASKGYQGVLILRWA